MRCRVIRISGTQSQWVLFFDNRNSTDTLTQAAQGFLAAGWLSMIDYAVLWGRVRNDSEYRTDGEWLNAALFGKLSPKGGIDNTTKQRTQPPGLTLVQQANLGWTPVPGNTFPVIGTYQHLPVTSTFNTCFEEGLAKGYPLVAPPGTKTLGAWQTRLHNDPTLAPGDKPFLWRVFVASAVIDASPGSGGVLGLPVPTAAQIRQYMNLRRSHGERGTPMFFVPVFQLATALTTVGGAVLPGP